MSANDKAPHGVDRRQRIEQSVHGNVYLETRIPTMGMCWLWTGSLSGNGRGGGYPRMGLNGHTVAVHRVMYTNQYGYIPGNKHIDHICRQRCCVNPRHLELVTPKTNYRRRDTA